MKIIHTSNTLLHTHTNDIHTARVILQFLPNTLARLALLPNVWLENIQ